MLPSKLLSIRKPLSFKLFLVFLVTSLALVSIFAAFLISLHAPNPSAHQTMHKNLLYLYNNLVDRIGNPPNLSRAQEVHEQLGVEIKIEGPQGTWSSTPLPAIADYEQYDRKEFPDVMAGRREKSFFMILSRGQTRYLFTVPGDPMFSIPVWKMLVIPGLILFILFLSYLTIKWILDPMNFLLSGVKELTSGNLNYRINVKDRDEFKDLAQAFNQMSDKINEMIRAKDRLLVDVSHELRSPLSRMKLALEMMPKSANRKTAGRAVAEMETMVKELLETERLKSNFGILSKSKVNLVSLVREVAGNYKDTKPGVEIRLKEPFPILEVDEARIRTVLTNVIENALKYSQEQSRPVKIDFHGKVGISPRITIKDFGDGIAQEDIPLVFEPFYRADKSRNKKTGGYGLGLSLCREIMASHGGNITLRSEPGQGTEVELVFPAPAGK